MKINRRRFLNLFAVILIAISIIGCSEEENSENDNPGDKVEQPATYTASVVTFDDNHLTADSYWGGAGTTHTEFTSENVKFPHISDAFSWSGFLYSNKTDVTTAGMTNQYSAYTEEAAAGNPGGVNGSDNYCLSYVAMDWMSGTYDPIPNILVIDEADNYEVPGFYITNTTYAYLSMLDGDAVAKKFGGVTGNDEDWFKIIIKGIDLNDNYTGTVEFYLADFRFTDNSKDYLIKEWTWVDLTSLGAVAKLEFFLASSDTGAFGMNTPAYFAMDDLTIKE